MRRAYFRGFSLLELLVVVVLLILIGTTAVPSFVTFIERNRALTLADQLQSQLAHARFVSVVSNLDVELCGSSDGQHCDDGWSSGWILRVPAEERVIGVHRLSGQEQLRWSRGSRAIRFRSNGTAPQGNGSFYICGGRAKSAIWQLTINRQGRVRRLPGAEDHPHCG